MSETLETPTEGEWTEAKHQRLMDLLGDLAAPKRDIARVAGCIGQLAFGAWALVVLGLLVYIAARVTP